MALRAFIFDVDGTLADTEELHRRAFNAAFARHGLPWYWGRRTYVGLLTVAGGKERISHFIDLSVETPAGKRRLLQEVPRIHADKTEIYASLLAGGGLRLRDGIARLLDEAREGGVRLAIASTTTPANIHALIGATLGTHAVNWFDVIAAGDQVAHKKPAPDIYCLALERLRIPPEDCLAFEDSANGLMAAKSAGLCTVVAPTYWTAEDDLQAADLRVGEFSDGGGLDGLRVFHSDWSAQRAVAA